MAADTTRYQPLQSGKASYLLLFALLLLCTLVGVYCAYNMEHAGHHITGMNNRVVWGLPHVFAISLIVAASGALNAATMSSVFGVGLYKPFARLSVILSLSLLAGGLAVLVLDLGRPDRLVIALTTYNFRSIFSWNIYLYTGFMVVGIVYLWMMLDKKFNRFTNIAGTVAFVWRIVLTTGTGSIFGFLVGRSALDTAVLAPLFIALSLVTGTAVLVVVILTIARWQNASVSDPLLDAFAKMLLWSLIALAYFSIVQHLTNLYIEQHRSDEQLVLSGPFATLFWVGHIAIGVVVPLLLLLRGRVSSGPRADSDRQSISSKQLLVASVAALLGGAALVYVIVISSQSSAQLLFPGKIVTASTFGDAGIAAYTPSVWEWGLGLGGVALSLMLFLLALRVLPLTPVLSQQTTGQITPPLSQPGVRDSVGEKVQDNHSRSSA